MKQHQIECEENPVNYPRCYSCLHLKYYRDPTVPCPKVYNVFWCTEKHCTMHHPIEVHSNKVAINVMPNITMNCKYYKQITLPTDIYL